MGYPVFFYGLACPTRFEHRKPSGDLSHRQSKKGVRRRTGRAVAPRRLPMLCPLAVVIREGKQREGARTVFDGVVVPLDSEIVADMRSEEHTSELQSLMRISYAVFCLKKKNKKRTEQHATD